MLGYDHVVVGAGSAGCAVASRLSEDPDRTVLLLEAGGWDVLPEIHLVDVPALLSLWQDGASAIDWGYHTEPEPALAGRRIPVARGKVVGGCSAVNALMWVRGSRHDYDAWAVRGNTGWAYDDVLPTLRKAEDFDGPAAGLRGVGGPIGVRRHHAPTPVAEAFVAATREAGFGPEQDYNGAQQEDFGFFYQTTRTDDGKRCSSATAYLHPALRRSNLDVATGARATRLLLRGPTVTGVEYVRDGITHQVRADAGVVLSAGAFESPKLLMLSGIGPSTHLAEHGIRCVADLQVGSNLQDHLFVPVCFASEREHPPAELVAEAGLFTRVRSPEGAPPDLQFTFGSVKFLGPDAPASAWAGPGFTAAAVALQPASTGRVELRDGRPDSRAVVRPNYLATDRDLDVLVDGIHLARDIVHRPALDAFRGDELGPGAAVTDRAGLARFVATTATTLWHPVGTCRMGVGPDAVVDPQLRVHGIEGLLVADASVMPSITSGNTNAPAVLIGERATELLTLGPRPVPEGAAVR